MARKKTDTIDGKTFNQEDVIATDLAHHAEVSYLEYAMSVVKGRAIPSVEDGLKPVQRRILFAMRDLSLDSTSKPKKSARVVGNVIGKYHPHGDGAVYEAMVRTAQSFSLRYPLVIGEGNFGSRDGDPAAAMRYTEAKMSAIASSFLSELDMGTVDWRNNYDNSTQEPVVLPARLPNILLNGAPGIGVGIATEIPPHNLREVVDAACVMIKNPKMTVDEVFSFIKGPDFPTGGQIISSQEDIRKAYLEGKGSVRLRARWKLEGEGTKNWKIVIYELPYATSTQQIMEEIERLMNPKPKEKGGKKIFTQEQLRLKAMFVGMIEKYNDGSDKDNLLRLVVEPKNSKQDPQELVNALLAYTSMEMNQSINLVAVGLDKTPKQKTLYQLLSEWCEFRVGTVERRTRHELDMAAKRLHILQGRLTILDHIEEVVKILKTAEEPKQALMDRFALSEIQAEDVMEIRLRQLAKLERMKILDEIAKLEAEINRLQKLLDSRTALRNQVVKELEADRKAFGDDRRTLIEASDKTVAKAVEEQAVSDDPVTVAVSERGWIRVKPGHSHAAEAFPFRSGDNVKTLTRATLSDYAVFLDESGKSYSIQLKDLPSAKGGEDVPIATLADFSSRLAAVVVGSLTHKYLVASSGGYGFICKISDMVTRLRAGKSLITVDAGSKVLPPCRVEEGIDPAQTACATISTNNRLLVYRLSEIVELPRGKGVALCGLDAECKLAQIIIAKNNALSVSTDDGKTRKLSAAEFAKHLQSRSSSKKGKPLEGVKSGQAVLVLTEEGAKP